MFELLRRFRKEITRDEFENVLKELADLREQNEKLKNDFKEVQQKYLTWLEETQASIREFRDRIAKKVSYLEKKEEKLDTKELLRNKILRRYGYLAKDLSSQNST